jgi:hypothetical protein
MPTASAHLAAALALLHDPTLAARPQLASGEPRGAFLLGNISPDVRIVSSLPREDTHFFGIPLSHDTPASQALLDTHPMLARAAALPPDQAAFVAGYMAHLVMDEAWMEFVVMPYIYLDDVPWSTGHPNFRLYSLLMTYLAEGSGRQVPPEQVAGLRTVQPRDWLPFASDADLLDWRNRVMEHALADSGWGTAQMFAGQMGIEADELYAVVTSKEAMEREVFPVVPREVLATFQRHTHQRCIAALNAYLTSPEL